jgi:hypothetical protein
MSIAALNMMMTALCGLTDGPIHKNVAAYHRVRTEGAMAQNYRYLTT